MDSKELKDRTTSFAHRCVKMAVSLPNTILGRYTQNQIVRCATSVAANYRAAVLAQSEAAFTAKVSIVLEEVDETLFWIEFIESENIIAHDKLADILNEANELTAIFYSTRKTQKTKNS
ncbi:MAG: four helix bundle protein [Candidatus Marinimicrobia bacterium]|nr:four helix bundle protein [Candidatus Neomarinimicrobiota bacterium]